MQPEISWAECRRVNEFRKNVDAQPDLESKADYAVKHSPTLNGLPPSFVVSYVGKAEWGGLAPYVDGVFTLSLGHIVLEVNATEVHFCMSLQTVRQDDKHVREFLEVLDEEGISYLLGSFEERKLPEIVLP